MATPASVGWNGELRSPELILLLLSLLTALLVVPGRQLVLYAATMAAVYFLQKSRAAHHQKLLLGIALMATFVALERQLPRYTGPLALGEGRGLRAIFVLRCLDYVLGKQPRSLEKMGWHRLGRFVLYVTFFATAFTGPVYMFNDFWRSYRPRLSERLRSLPRHLGKCFWASLKLFVVQPVLLGVLARVGALMEGGGPFPPVVGPGIFTWLYVVLNLVWFYFFFSGVTDLALGVCRILGFQLYDNFANPLFSTNPATYWTSWNISAYRWLMTHVFYPFWGHSQLVRKVYTTFLASTLWHVTVIPEVTIDAIVQMLVANVIYATGVAAVLRYSLRSENPDAEPERGLLGDFAIRIGKIVATLLFIAAVHQIFWAGLVGIPSSQTIAIFRRMSFGLVAVTDG